MIIVLKNANFSASNIGTLSTWRIMHSIGAGASYSGPISVDKGAACSAVITLAEGYEVGAAGVVVTMGGIALVEGEAYSINENVITITIAEVTGNVLIKVPTANTSTGEEEEPEVPDTPDVPSVIDMTDRFIWTNGTAIEATTIANPGKTYTTPLFKSSNYVDISETPDFEMSFVTWRSSTGNQATLGYALYDADKNYVSGYRFDLADASLGNSAGAPYMIEVHVTDPTVKYIRTCYPVDESKYGVFKANTIEALSDPSEPSAPVSTDITDLFSFTDGAAIETYTGSGNGGATFNTSLFKYSDYVDITDITPFEMSFVTWKSGAGKKATLGYALYDASKTYIDGVAFEFAADSSNSSGEPCMITVDPSNANAKYIRTCYPVDTAKYGEFKAYKLG